MAVSPASTLTTTASIAHEATEWVDRVALDNLKKALRFGTLTEARRLPRASGKVWKGFRYIPFAANTATGTEGTIGTGIAPTTEQVSATIAQYFDFVNFSDLYLETIIDDALTNVGEELGYRAGLTVDTLIRDEFDAGTATVSAALLGANLAAGDFRQLSMLLEGNDVQPKEGGEFLSLGHPFVLYDMIAETAAGGFIDMVKYTSENARKLFQGNALGSVNGVAIGKSTNVSTSGAAATTKYWVYVVGKGAVASINLGEASADGARNPEVSVLRHGKSASDPAGVIGGSVAYNFRHVSKRLKTTNDSERYRMVAADSSIAS